MVSTAASRSVVITGSSRGIGLGYAREFLARGHRVVLSGRSETDLEGAVRALSGDVSADRIATLCCDVSDIDQVQALWDAAISAHGQVDIWINNAGFARSGVTLLELTAAEIQLMVETNIVGTMNGCQVAVRGFKSQPDGGLVVNTLGGGAKGRVVDGMIGYSTTKRAIRMFSKGLAKETKDNESIRIATLSPGVNITEGMIREIEALPEAERAKMVKPLNFIGDHVSTTTPWLVDQLLESTDKVFDVTWLSNGRLLRRGLRALRSKRDIMAEYGY